MGQIGGYYRLHCVIIVLPPISEDEVDLFANILLIRTGWLVLRLLRTLHDDFALAHFHNQVFAVELSMSWVVNDDNVSPWLDEACEDKDIAAGCIMRGLVH